NRTAERVAQENRRGGDGELRLQRFMKNGPLIFDGGYDPEGAQKWLETVERIFKAMRCQDEHKVTLEAMFYMKKPTIGGEMQAKDW
ncbi:cellular nucleic acid-binding protein, partial [Trifolium medium]|nr:cellular nucleic acid-binding protein [Trifolium medium]